MGGYDKEWRVICCLIVPMTSEIEEINIIMVVDKNEKNVLMAVKIKNIKAEKKRKTLRFEEIFPALITKNNPSAILER